MHRNAHSPGIHVKETNERKSVGIKEKKLYENTIESVKRPLVIDPAVLMVDSHQSVCIQIRYQRDHLQKHESYPVYVFGRCGENSNNSHRSSVVGHVENGVDNFEQLIPFLVCPACCYREQVN